MIKEKNWLGRGVLASSSYISPVASNAAAAARPARSHKHPQPSGEGAGGQVCPSR
jgi:hypothetical protein